MCLGKITNGVSFVVNSFVKSVIRVVKIEFACNYLFHC
jgi:hypothetical protein